MVIKPLKLFDGRHHITVDMYDGPMFKIIQDTFDVP